MAGRAGKVQVAVYDLATGREWSLGSGTPQAEASVVKLDILETLLTQRPDGEGRWLVTVLHRDSRSWEVDVIETVSEPARPESCGKAAGTPSRMDVLSVRGV